MAIEHKTLPIFGVQFHPESIATDHGHQLLKNFLNSPSKL
jgi:anthranilate synthase component 2